MNNIICNSTDDVQLDFNEGVVVELLEKLCLILNISNKEIEITLCTDELITYLNENYKNKKGVTDILSFTYDSDDFPQGESEFVHLGELYLSIPAVKQNCINHNVIFEDEIKRLIIHGVLHLQKHTHASYQNTEPMLIKQEELLEKVKNIRIK